MVDDHALKPDSTWKCFLVWAGADPENFQGEWPESAHVKFLNTPNFVGLVHAHFVGMWCLRVRTVFFNISGFLCILVLLPNGSATAKRSLRSYSHMLVSSHCCTLAIGSGSATSCCMQYSTSNLTFNKVYIQLESITEKDAVYLFCMIRLLMHNWNRCLNWCFKY